MQNKFNGENLQVGDKVIVFASNVNLKKYYVGEVVKKTATGLLDVSWEGNKMRFRPTGYEYYSKDNSFYRISYYLEDYTEDRAEQIQRYNHKEKLVKFLSKIEWKKYSVEELDSIYKYLSNLHSS